MEALACGLTVREDPRLVRPIPRMGDVDCCACGDSGNSYKLHMARLAPGHFSIQPEDLDGREMVTTVRTATDGELIVEFKATIHMEMFAFQRLAEKKFKGVYWLSEQPADLKS